MAGQKSWGKKMRKIVASLGNTSLRSPGKKEPTSKCRQFLRAPNCPQILVESSDGLTLTLEVSKRMVSEGDPPPSTDVERNVAYLVSPKRTSQLSINHRRSTAGRQQEALPNCLRHKPRVIRSHFLLFRAGFLKILCLS